MGHYNAEETLRVMYLWDEYGNLDEKNAKSACTLIHENRRFSVSCPVIGKPEDKRSFDIHEQPNLLQHALFGEVIFCALMQIGLGRSIQYRHGILRTDRKPALPQCR